MPDGHIDRAADSLLWAVGELQLIPIHQAEPHIDAAIARIHAASSTALTDYVGMLEALKTDVAAIRDRINKAASEIEELAVRIDHGGIQETGKS
jgi:hypothetical protein